MKMPAGSLPIRCLRKASGHKMWRRLADALALSVNPVFQHPSTSWHSDIVCKVCKIKTCGAGIRNHAWGLWLNSRPRPRSSCATFHFRNLSPEAGPQGPRAPGPQSLHIWGLTLSRLTLMFGMRGPSSSFLADHSWPILRHLQISLLFDLGGMPVDVSGSFCHCTSFHPIRQFHVVP